MTQRYLKKIRFWKKTCETNTPCLTFSVISNPRLGFLFLSSFIWAFRLFSLTCGFPTSPTWSQLFDLNSDWTPDCITLKKFSPLRLGKYSLFFWCKKNKSLVIWCYMGVSKNNGIPKSSILIGFSIISHPFWGTPIFGNIHIVILSTAFPQALGCCFLKMFIDPIFDVHLPRKFRLAMHTSMSNNILPHLLDSLKKCGCLHTSISLTEIYRCFTQSFMRPTTTKNSSLNKRSNLSTSVKQFFSCHLSNWKCGYPWESTLAVGSPNIPQYALLMTHL